MPDLTFGEQVKIVLSRRGMTIKELAEIIEERTGKKMSRQNLTQRLGRDNFQEQDMRMIASILKCPFQLSILGEDILEESEEDMLSEKRIIEDTERSIVEESAGEDTEKNTSPSERGITVGEFLDIQEEMDESASDMLLKEVLAEMDAIERENKEREHESKHHNGSDESEKTKKSGWMSHLKFRRREEKTEEKEENTSYFDEEDESVNVDEVGIIDADDFEPEEEKTDPSPKPVLTKEIEPKKEPTPEKEEENPEIGDVNPYTGREYATNSVRMHPKRIGYVQVYDRKVHKWTDMTEWAFLGYQERKKVLLGKDYEPPIYLD